MTRRARSKQVRATEQLGLFRTRGGKRRGAGRPPKGPRAGSPHKTRPFLHSRYPVHVTLRAIADVGYLRNPRVYQAVRRATMKMAGREDFRIVHLSIQGNHIHLLVEAKHKEALAAGMKAFQISAAKHLNAAISKDRPGPRRRGAVFPDRYHATIITTPTQARHAIAYVLGNFRKHREDRHELTATWKVDPFSSGVSFAGWAEYGDSLPPWQWPPTYDPLITDPPNTWLLAKGWKKAGSVSCYEVPSART